MFITIHWRIIICIFLMLPCIAYGCCLLLYNSMMLRVGRRNGDEMWEATNDECKKCKFMSCNERKLALWFFSLTHSPSHLHVTGRAMDYDGSEEMPHINGMIYKWNIIFCTLTHCICIYAQGDEELMVIWMNVCLISINHFFFDRTRCAFAQWSVIDSLNN